jgi:hypothetical protein
VKKERIKWKNLKITGEAFGVKRKFLERKKKYAGRVRKVILKLADEEAEKKYGKKVMCPVCLCYSGSREMQGKYKKGKMYFKCVQCKKNFYQARRAQGYVYDSHGTLHRKGVKA